MTLVRVMIVPGAKAYLDIPYQQMVQHGLRPSNKLSHTVFGPFPIVKQHTANSFELDLGTSASKRVINVFHVKYLRHAPENDPYQPIDLLDLLNCCTAVQVPIVLDLQVYCTGRSIGLLYMYRQY